MDALTPAPPDPHYPYDPCGWSVPHNSKHQCSCVCVMPQGHDTKCKCEVEYP